MQTTNLYESDKISYLIKNLLPDKLQFHTHKNYASFYNKKLLFMFKSTEMSEMKMYA